MNMIDYVKKEQRSMLVFPFHDVDSLVLSQLAYLDYSFLVGKKFEEIKKEKFLKLLNDNYEDKDNLNLLQAVISSSRFRHIEIAYYEEETDVKQEKQFAAVCFFLETGDIYISFRGTDSTVVGWKEDFNMSYLCPVPSQIKAMLYVREIIKKTTKPLILGGHSKGGNLAVYGGCMQSEKDRSRIKVIYSHDGPGFQKEFLTTPFYQAMKNKIEKTVPESSLIGMLLYHQEPYKIVKSNRHFLMQHDPFSWQIENGEFILASQFSVSSFYTNEVLKDFIAGLSKEERENFVNAFFEIFEKSEIVTLKDFGNVWNYKIPRILYSMQNLDDTSKKYLWEAIKELVVVAIKNLPSILN